jgi:hypothetical protein
MKKNILIFLFLFLALLSLDKSCAQAQFELPQQIQLKAREDYAKYETTVVDAAKWLERTDLDKDIGKRKKINDFIVQWVSGSPTVTISLDEPLARITEKNPDLLALYLASYSRYIIENKGSPNIFYATKAGLTSISLVYRKGIDVSRSKLLEKLKDSVQIEEYIVNTLKIPRT